MSRREKRRLAAAAGIAGLLLVGFWFWLTDESRITGANLGRVHIGMSRPEVEAILGAPTRPYEKTWRLESGADGQNEHLVEEQIGCWRQPEYWATVHFDADDHVVYRDGKAWITIESEPIWIRARHWLGF